jgi:O-antigen ligase
VAIAVVSCAIAAPALIMRTMGGRNGGTFNTSGRSYAWDFFQGFVAENPMTGKGLGFCSIAVKLYMSSFMSESFVETFRTPHNEYLRWLVDGGVFFALGIFVVIVTAFVMAARAQHGAARALIVAFALGTVALSYVDNTFSTVQFSVPLVILLGLLAAHPGGATRSFGRHRAKPLERDVADPLIEDDAALNSEVAVVKG